MRKPFVVQDKLGPFCRKAADCAVILDIIRGEDPQDPSSRDINLPDPFAVDVSQITVGYMPGSDPKVTWI